ncbi:hypothetical protein [Fontivita pretiosa]|uniref:hypothetical protein n=1 Tax=Fontivita pretiosa TaxID=2989684 RepID=UPI003D17FB47
MDALRTPTGPINGAPAAEASPREQARRRGSIYIAVLGAAMIVLTLAVGGILAARAQARSSDSLGEAAAARLAAQSALELARLWISQDPNWRSTRPNGTWASGLSVGGATISISAQDPIDNNLANRPHDPVVLSVVGQKGASRHRLSITLNASPQPLSTLGYAIHVPGQLRVRNRRVKLGAATASTNSGLRNEGTIEGAAEVASVVDPGIVYGGIVTGTPARPLPSTDIAALYSALATEISGISAIDRRALGPGINPWGSTNPDGVYLIRSSSNVTISTSRIVGTLVIIAPGKKVVLSDALLLEPARADYPALVVVGNLEIQCSGSLQLLENDANLTLNPAGLPYNGVSDNDKSDAYPSEIRGLVYATGSISFSNDPVLRGCIISGSSASSDAVFIDGDITIRYDPALMTNPPQGFTSSVTMVPLAGSLRQLVD